MNKTTHHAPRLTATAGLPYGSIKALSVSPGIPTRPLSRAHGPDFLTCRLPGARCAFTLVELLVVIGIIATLAALVTPAVMRAQSAARNAAIKAEIDMLHMAIMNYKNEYGSFPPCADTANGKSGYVNKHLQRLFPRSPSGNLAIANQIDSITPQTAVVPWLLGYTDDPTDPIANASPSLTRKKLYDFDQSRVSGFQYAPSGKPNSPYIYINSSHYLQFPYAGGSSGTPGAFRVTYVNDPTPFANASQSWANPDTFQILCAGRDETFGTDDDISNFWPGTRKDYLDSLKQ
jgi:prepilin-type N-terminal cleavage/methylation domain-containing protein